MPMLNRFLFDVVLPRNEICNLKSDQQQLLKTALDGGHLVYFGKRNMGKTSVVRSVVIEDFVKAEPKALVLVVDFLGASSMNDFNHRVRVAFEHAMSRLNPTGTFISNLTKAIKSIRPSMTTDSITGDLGFSLGIDHNVREIPFQEILKQCAAYHEKFAKCLLVFDEFQEIALVKGAEAAFRSCFQELPGDLPIIILGSKKHLLSRIFADPSSPLANWGGFLEASEISAEEYLAYANERFHTSNQSIDLETCHYLKLRLQSNPECMNIVCFRLMRSEILLNKVLDRADVERCITKVVDERASVYLEFLSHFSELERKFLSEIAKRSPVLKPHGKEFLSAIKASTGSSGPMLKKMLDQAVVYQDPNGITLADPLLKEYLVRYN